MATQIDYRLMNKEFLLDPVFSDLPCYNDDYIKCIFQFQTNTIAQGAMSNRDYCNKYVSVVNGQRLTTDQPELFENTIYLHGSSWIFGFGCEDKHTLASYLQRACNNDEKFKKYIVKNYGVQCAPFWNRYLSIKNHNLKAGDYVFVFIRRGLPRELEDILNHLKIINDFCKTKDAKLLVFLAPITWELVNPTRRELILECCSIDDIAHNRIDENKFKVHKKRYQHDNTMLMCSYWGIPCIDLQPLADRPHEMGEVFLDHFHWSYKLNNKIASYVFDFVSSSESCYDINYDIETSCTEELRKIIKRFFSTKQILEYIKNVKNKYDFSQYKKIGCIVMNANPFTNGHLHLVRYAIQHVEALYIFVVENNQSYFDFNDRFNLVKAGVEGIEFPICVIPSGKFIISSFTFPDYFTKETKPMNQDSSFDIYCLVQ